MEYKDLTPAELAKAPKSKIYILENEIINSRGHL
jgi:hypothetical protein